MFVKNCNIFIFSKFGVQSFLNFQTANKKSKIHTITAYKNGHFSLLTCGEERFSWTDTVLVKCILVSSCSM